ncbi:Gfo/Idh/MocA family oxidoreductase [Paenibacillus sp. WQ 127069]|uniref:Gfo/Idh/MocA family oxidoreductase n=1 Tax=Paenibacillus baimaensis TaxID=2982185 RepID=A0ABT2UA12_9BACL|nr:Gfo/Idh/MocA family oxidoreductase [Paenibacillus sp. WQ 127069]MCU6790841.1 Gfo/Idh/MocA family oxidoreductase [Paenibacillus sp. WQ 127069]
MKKRIGLIGLGDIAQKVYLPLLAAHEQVELIGVTSRTEATVNRIADQYRINGRFYALETLLEARPDAVFIHSPTETHYEVVMTCLQRGIAVYVDKPLSYELHESEAMAAYAQEQGVLLAVGFNRRFAPMYMKARTWLEEAGGFELSVVQKQRTKLQAHSARHTLYDDLIHMLDLLLWLGGDLAEIGHYYERVDETGKLLVGAGSLLFANEQADKSLEEQIAQAHTGPERLGQFSMVRRAGADLEKLELHGAYRSAEVLNMESLILSERSQEPQHIGFGSWDTILHRRGFAGVVQHFLSSLEEPGDCSIRADQVLPVHRLVERLTQALD